jgi:hypothetical protein
MLILLFREDWRAGTALSLFAAVGLFHRLRAHFLDVYQALVISEPESAVSQPVKEVFLTLRQAAETGIASSFRANS